jgi:hypothetical protein
MVVVNFYDKNDNETFLQVLKTDDVIDITIIGNGIQSIALDEETAIKLVKELKKQISYLKNN